ncbi:hypothetical protein F4776DRAFT_663283 [Hypoxylon sp. NC0597]|nr:hypothetical protein F4776DRAFT_663283 [Hypoxylon sp. NC0597]
MISQAESFLPQRLFPDCKQGSHVIVHTEEDAPVGMATLSFQTLILILHIPPLLPLTVILHPTLLHPHLRYSLIHKFPRQTPKTNGVGSGHKGERTQAPLLCLHHCGATNNSPASVSPISLASLGTLIPLIGTRTSSPRRKPRSIFSTRIKTKRSTKLSFGGVLPSQEVRKKGNLKRWESHWQQWLRRKSRPTQMMYNFVHRFGAWNANKGGLSQAGTSVRVAISSTTTAIHIGQSSQCNKCNRTTQALDGPVATQNIAPARA